MDRVRVIPACKDTSKASKKQTAGSYELTQILKSLLLLLQQGPGPISLKSTGTIRFKPMQIVSKRAKVEPMTRLPVSGAALDIQDNRSGCCVA
jgi:hypothetical protein